MYYDSDEPRFNTVLLKMEHASQSEDASLSFDVPVESLRGHDTISYNAQGELTTYFGHDLLPLHRRKTESLVDYYLRIDWRLALIFKSITTISYTGDSIEVLFEKNAEYFQFDLHCFRKAKLDADLVIL